MSPRQRIAIIGPGHRLLERVTFQCSMRARTIRSSMIWAVDERDIDGFVIGVHADRIPSHGDAVEIARSVEKVLVEIGPHLAAESSGIIAVTQPNGSSRTRDRLIALIEDTVYAAMVRYRNRDGIDVVLNILDLRPKEDGRTLASQVARWLTGPRPLATGAVVTPLRLQSEGATQALGAHYL